MRPRTPSAGQIPYDRWHPFSICNYCPFLAISMQWSQKGNFLCRCIDWKVCAGQLTLLIVVLQFNGIQFKQNNWWVMMQANGPVIHQPNIRVWLNVNVEKWPNRFVVGLQCQKIMKLIFPSLCSRWLVGIICIPVFSICAAVQFFLANILHFLNLIKSISP